MENEQQPQQEPVQPAAQPPMAAPDVKPEPIITQPGFSMPTPPSVTEPLTKPQTEQEASPTVMPSYPSGEKPKKTGSGMMKWILAGVGVLVIGGGAAGLYFSGVFNGQPQNQPLYGAATEASTVQSSEQASSQTASDASQQIDTSNFSQMALNACPVGQVMDPVSNRCGCDLDNNYFEMTIPGAYAQPVAGFAQAQCTTCEQLSAQILKLGESNDPADITLKTQLQGLAQQNNCTPCSVFDDQISQAQQNHTWDQYFQLVVQKSQDKTCGRSLPTCDSMKWQLLFLNDLLVKAGNDPQTTPAMMQTLKDEQSTISEDLGNNSTCYTIQNLCENLKAAYAKTATPGTSTQQGISSMLLQGENTGSPSASLSQQAASQQSQQLAATYTQQDGTQVDLNSLSPDQLFSKNYYMLHCPVDASLTQQSTPSQQTSAPKKVRRVPAASAPAPSPAPSASKPAPSIPSLNGPKGSP